MSDDAIIPASRLAAGATHFRCEPLRSPLMSVVTCVARQRAARGKSERTGGLWSTPMGFTACKDCPIGEEVARAAGEKLPAAPPRRDPPPALAPERAAVDRPTRAPATNRAASAPMALCRNNDGFEVHRSVRSGRGLPPPEEGGPNLAGLCHRCKTRVYAQWWKKQKQLKSAEAPAGAAAE